MKKIKIINAILCLKGLKILISWNIYTFQEKWKYNVNNEFSVDVKLKDLI